MRCQLLLTGVYGPLVLCFMMICALACACAPGEFDSPEWYGPGAALPLWCAACPAPGAAVVAAAWLAASVPCVAAVGGAALPLPAGRAAPAPLVCTAWGSFASAAVLPFGAFRDSAGFCT